jgi:hypothetical protein
MKPGYRGLFYMNGTRIKGIVPYNWNKDTEPCSIKMGPEHRNFYVKETRLLGLILYK